MRGSTPTMAWSGAVGVGLEPHPVAHDHPGGVALGLAGEHRADLAVGGGDAVDRPVALEHGAEERRHHSAGARAMASSSAAFTSYSESALSRSAASASVRPQASVSVSTWPDGPVARRRPAHEQQRRAVEPAQVRLLVHVDGHRVRLAVAASEGRGPLVLGHVAAQRQLAHRPGTDSRTMLPRRKAMLAGRSASRRMR